MDVFVSTSDLHAQGSLIENTLAEMLPPPLQIETRLWPELRPDHIGKRRSLPRTLSWISGERGREEKIGGKERDLREKVRIREKKGGIGKK